MTEAPPKPFILINIPKTGSMYASTLVQNADLLSAARKFGMDGVLLRHPHLRDVIFTWWWRLHRRGVRLTSGRMNSREHHTSYYQLSPPQRRLPAIACLREPLSWYVSRYLFTTSPLEGGYRLLPQVLQYIRDFLQTPQEPQHQAAVFLEQYLGGQLTPQAWRSLSFEGFCYFMQHLYRFHILKSEFSRTVPPSFPLGAFGCRTLSFVHRDPKRLFTMPPEEVEAYFADGRWRRDLADARFLRFEHLQEDLRFVMLGHLGYDREILDAAAQLTPERINVSDPTRKEQALRELEQKPQLREEILRNERLYAEHLLPLAGSFRND